MSTYEILSLFLVIIGGAISICRSKAQEKSAAKNQEDERQYRDNIDANKRYLESAN